MTNPSNIFYESILLVGGISPTTAMVSSDCSNGFSGGSLLSGLLLGGLSQRCEDVSSFLVAWWRRFDLLRVKLFNSFSMESLFGTLASS